MKRPAVLAAALAMVALAGAAPPPARAGANFWTSLGPNGGFVRTVVADPSNPQRLYAGSLGGVFKSVDGGATWRAASRGLLIHPITALAVDPHQPGTVYATAGDTTTLEVGFAVSRDGAATWSQTMHFSNGYARDGGEEYFSSLAVDPARRGTVFAATNFGVVVSHDRGQDWSLSLGFESINPQDGLTVQLVADPTRGSVFAYVSGAELYGNRDPYVKLFESADGGATWSDRSAALPAATAARLAIEPTSPGILHLQQAGKIFRSIDGAASWQETGAAQGPIAAGPHGLAVAGSRPIGVVASRDGGRTWVAIATPPVDGVTSYAFGASPGQIYASGNALGVVASDDGGKSWTAANHGLTATAVLAVAVDPSLPTRIYTALADGDGSLGISGVYKTRNGGSTWRPIGTELPFAGTDPVDQASLFVVDPAQTGTLMYGTGAFAARSADAGASWTPLPPLPSGLLASSMAPAPASPSVVYAAGQRFAGACSAFKTVDGGATWSCLPLARISQVVPAPSDPAIVYAAGFVDFNQPQEHFLWRSANAGASWAPIDARLPFRLQVDFDQSRVAVDPSDAQRLFVAGTTGVWRSLDGGAHWSETDSGLPLAAAAQFPFSYAPLLAIDPGNPQLVYAGASYLGVYRSLDGGNHWRPIVAGLPPLNQFVGNSDRYQALTPDPRHSGTVYLATLGDGLLTYTAQ